MKSSLEMNFSQSWQRCEPTKSEKTDDLKQDGEGRNAINVPISVQYVGSWAAAGVTKIKIDVFLYF